MEKPDARARAAAVLLLIQPSYIVCELLVAAAVAAPYSLRDHTISDLAAVSCTQIAYPAGPVAVCSPWHPLLNGAFIGFGLALAIGALLLPHAWRPGRLGVAAVALWVVSGLSSIGTGLVPLDVDLELHTLVSLPVFLAQPVALLLHGLALRGRPLAVWALVVAVLSAVGTVGLFAVTMQATWHGAFERLALWPAYVWLGAFGWRVLRERPADRPRPGQAPT